MYRFVSTILDEDANIRSYAAFCLVSFAFVTKTGELQENVLLKQFPDMFYRHFIECLLYFNDISKNHLTGGQKLVFLVLLIQFFRIRRFRGRCSPQIFSKW